MFEPGCGEALLHRSCTCVYCEVSWSERIATRRGVPRHNCFGSCYRRLPHDLLDRFSPLSLPAGGASLASHFTAVSKVLVCSLGATVAEIYQWSRAFLLQIAEQSAVSWTSQLLLNTYSKRTSGWKIQMAAPSTNLVGTAATLTFREVRATIIAIRRQGSA